MVVQNGVPELVWNGVVRPGVDPIDVVVPKLVLVPMSTVVPVVSCSMVVEPAVWRVVSGIVDEMCSVVSAKRMKNCYKPHTENYCNRLPVPLDVVDVIVSVPSTESPDPCMQSSSSHVRSVPPVSFCGVVGCFVGGT